MEQVLSFVSSIRPCGIPYHTTIVSAAECCSSRRHQATEAIAMSLWRPLLTGGMLLTCAQVMYYFMGKMMVLQPDAEHTFVRGEAEASHPMLPPGPGLYTLREPSLVASITSDARRRLARVGSSGAAQAAKVCFLGHLPLVRGGDTDSWGCTRCASPPSSPASPAMHASPASAPAAPRRPPRCAVLEAFFPLWGRR